VWSCSATQLDGRQLSVKVTVIALKYTKLTHDCLKKWRCRTRPLKQYQRRCIASCGASEMWRDWWRRHAIVSVCNDSVSAAPLCVATKGLTGRSRSRATISGATHNCLCSATMCSDKGSNGQIAESRCYKWRHTLHVSAAPLCVATKGLTGRTRSRATIRGATHYRL